MAIIGSCQLMNISLNMGSTFEEYELKHDALITFDIDISPDCNVCTGYKVWCGLSRSLKVHICPTVFQKSGDNVQFVTTACRRKITSIHKSDRTLFCRGMSWKVLFKIVRVFGESKSLNYANLTKYLGDVVIGRTSISTVKALRYIDRFNCKIYDTLKSFTITWGSNPSNSFFLL